MTTLLTHEQVSEVSEARVQAILDLEQALNAMDPDVDTTPLEARLAALKEERRYQWFSYYQGSETYLQETDLREVKVKHLWNILHLVMTRRMAEKFEAVLEQICSRGVCSHTVPTNLYVSVLNTKDAALAWRFSKLQDQDDLNVYQFFFSLYKNSYNMELDKFNKYFNSMKELIINFGV